MPSTNFQCFSRPVQHRGQRRLSVSDCGRCIQLHLHGRVLPLLQLVVDGHLWVGNAPDRRGQLAVHQSASQHRRLSGGRDVRGLGPRLTALHRAGPGSEIGEYVKELSSDENSR